ncbi:MAG: 2-C-methyl-D-erythritol 4-phosphate cytidylyltransferase [Fibrobacterota bacterium]
MSGQFVSAIIPAGGTGSRMGGDIPKQFMDLAGKPVIRRTLDVFEKSPSINEIIVVLSPSRKEFFREKILGNSGLKKISALADAGIERYHSVKNGLEHINKKASMILVHDAARPFVTPEIIEKAIAQCAEKGSVITAIPCQDTIKRADKDCMVCSNISRSGLYAVQTPQVFRREIFEEAYSGEYSEDCTDDSYLVEKLGKKTYITEGSRLNFKLTAPEDFCIAEALIAGRGGKTDT